MATAYIVTAWLIVQVADTVAPILGLPDTLQRLTLTGLAIGFPVAIVLAWIYELGPGGLRKDSGAEIAPRHGRKLDFAYQLEHSFLPEIVRMAGEKGMQVVMVRMPTQIFPDPALEPEGLAGYNADLGAYLGAQGIPLLDFEHDPRFPPEDFTEPTHLDAEAKQRFTKILAEALLKLQP